MQLGTTKCVVDNSWSGLVILTVLRLRSMAAKNDEDRVARTDTQYFARTAAITYKC